MQCRHCDERIIFLKGFTQWVHSTNEGFFRQRCVPYVGTQAEPIIAHQDNLLQEVLNGISRKL